MRQDLFVLAGLQALSLRNLSESASRAQILALRCPNGPLSGTSGADIGPKLA